MWSQVMFGLAGSPASAISDKSAACKVSAQRLQLPLKAHLRKDLLLSHFQAQFLRAMDAGLSSPVDIDQRPPSSSSHCRSLPIQKLASSKCASREGQAKAWSQPFVA